MRIPISKRIPFVRSPLVGIFLGFVFGLLGYFLSFVASPGSAQNATVLESTFISDLASLEALPPETVVALEGTLEGNPELDENGLVAYVLHRLVERPATSDSDAVRNRWEYVESNFALLHLEIPGGSILMTAPGTIAAISGDPTEVIDTSTEFVGRPATFNYNGQQLATGARRISGLRNGDLVSVIGTRTGSGDLFLSQIHAGDRASFQAALEEQSVSTNLFGYGALGLGGLLVLFSILALIRRVIRGV